MPERVQGIAMHWNEMDARSAYGQIITNDGRKFHANALQVRVDGYLKRFLVAGEPVIFTPEPASGRRFPHAFDIERPWADKNADLSTYREVCLVLDDKFLVRQIGGWLFIFPPDRDNLRAGMIVECGIKLPDNGYKNPIAKDIQILAIDESEYDAMEAGNV